MSFDPFMTFYDDPLQHGVDNYLQTEKSRRIRLYNVKKAIHRLFIDELLF